MSKISDRFYVENGWKLAPHQWWRFLLMPFGWQRVSTYGGGYFSLSVFGFAIFWTW